MFFYLPRLLKPNGEETHYLICKSTKFRTKWLKSGSIRITVSSRTSNYTKKLFTELVTRQINK